MPTVTKKDLVLEVASQTNLTQKEVSQALEALISTITTQLCDGADVALRGFGSFRLYERSSHTVRNPSLPGERIVIPAHHVVRFKPSPRLRKSIRDLDPAMLQASNTENDYLEPLTVNTSGPKPAPNVPIPVAAFCQSIEPESMAPEPGLMMEIMPNAELSPAS